MSVLESMCVPCDAPSVCSYQYSGKIRRENHVQFLINHIIQCNVLHSLWILLLCYIIFSNFIFFFFLFAFPFYPCLQHLKNKIFTQNSEVTSTKESGSSTAEICTLTFLFYVSVKEEKKRNQLEIHTRFATSKMSPSHLTIHINNTVPLGRQDRF